MKRPPVRVGRRGATTVLVEDVELTDEHVARADLTSREEQVIRMLHGLTVSEIEPLDRKTQDPDVLERLLEIEAIAYGHLHPAPPEDDPDS